jgi:hypothetical protein
LGRPTLLTVSWARFKLGVSRGVADFLVIFCPLLRAKCMSFPPATVNELGVSRAIGASAEVTEHIARLQVSPTGAVCQRNTSENFFRS